MSTVTPNSKVALLGVPTHWGVGIKELIEGPRVFREQGIIQKLESAGFSLEDAGDIDCESTEKPEVKNPRAKYLEQVQRVAEKSSQKIAGIIQQGRRPLVIGGDHSLEIGTISGAAAAIKNLGLIYIDEHGDMSTPETTESGNIHGMSLASVMGFGDNRLITIQGPAPRVSKHNVIHIGGAELDKHEYEFIDQEKIKTFSIISLLADGWRQVFEAITALEQKTDAIWVSVDLDSIHCDDAPGVTMPDKNGLFYREILTLARYIGEQCTVAGASVTEYNRATDKDFQTVELGVEIGAALLGGRYSWYGSWMRKHYAEMTGGEKLVDI